DAGSASEHVLDEALVAGDIDDAETVVAEVQAGKTDVDRDAAGLFFGQAVAIDAGERFDQAGFAVIDVAGSAEDQIAWHRRSSSCGRVSLILLTGDRPHERGEILCRRFAIDAVAQIDDVSPSAAGADTMARGIGHLLGSSGPEEFLINVALESLLR